jgi:hypothetical protein
MNVTIGLPAPGRDETVDGQHLRNMDLVVPAVIFRHALRVLRFALDEQQ